MTCLQMPQLVVVALELPMGTIPFGVVTAPGISMVSTSHVMRDEATGVTYINTVTTSIWRVALSSPNPEALTSGPTIKDVTGHE